MLICLFVSSASAQSLAYKVDWAGFLGRSDPVWDRMPMAWSEGPFMGNGRLGLMIYEDPEAHALRFDLGHTDAQDHRSGNGGGFAHARLPIGHFLLHTVGKVNRTSTFRLDLWQAETHGVIRTSRGTIRLHAYVHATDDVIVIDATPSIGEASFRWKWVGEQADSPRQTFGRIMNDPKRLDPTYLPNPKGHLSQKDAILEYIQPLGVGGGTVTAWQTLSERASRRLIVSIAHSFPDMSAEATAVATVKHIAQINPQSLVRRHRAWWHAWYPRSFLSLSDTRMESFYWIQMYKLASATRANRSVIDNQGPWLQLTPWPYATWNLNVQLSYSPVYTANRLDIGESLVNALHNHKQTLINNVDAPYREDSAGIGRSSGGDLISRVGRPGVLPQNPADTNTPPPEAGLLTWALYYAWEQYRYSMEEATLRDTVYPLLRRSVNYYRHFLTQGADGRYHLPATVSPEYGASPDANFDLSLLRWGCQTLLEANMILKLNDPLTGAWQDILDKLTDYPRDTNGFMIGAGTPYAFSHRHYSHMLMVYPLYLVNHEQRGGADLIKASLDYWQSKPEALQGYSNTGAASISASIDRGDDALHYLSMLQTDFLQPNTLYRESGPVIETPLSGATAMQDMILQSWGGTVRVFPAVPKAWPDIVFDTMRTEGAFLVSAGRKGGSTRWITVKSLAGQPLRLKTDLSDPLGTVDGKPRAFTRDETGTMIFNLPKGKTLVVTSRMRREMPLVGIVPALSANINTYGLNARSPHFKANSLNIK